MEQTTVEDLSPGARRLYGLLIGGSASPTSAASPRAPRSVSSTAAPEKDLLSVTPSTCSTVCPGADKTMSPTSEAAASASTSIPVSMSDTSPAASSSPESEVIYQLLMADQSVYEIRFAEYAEKYHASSRRRSGDLPARAPAPAAAQAAVAGHSCSAASVSTESVLSARPSATAPTTPSTPLNVAPIAVDINANDLATLVLTSCSSECPSHDTDVPLSVLTSSAALTSSPTIGDVVPELAAPVVSDKALNVHVMGDTALMAAICLSGGLDNSTGEEDHVDVSLPPGSAPASIVMLDDTRPLPVSPPLSDFVCPDAHLNATPKPLEENPQHVDIDHVGLTQLDSGQPVICTASTTGLEPMFSGVLNICITRGVDFTKLDVAVLHESVRAEILSTVDGYYDGHGDDWQPPWPPQLEFLHFLVVDLETTLTASMVLQPRGIDELQPWAHPFGTERELHFPCFQPTSFYSRSWVLVNCDFTSLHFQWAITVQQSASSVVFLASLNGRAAVQQHYTCTPGHGWIPHYILRVNPHYYVLMQGSVNHSQLQCEFRFYTAGHVLFFCWALVQWKIPWTIILVSLRSWFQCYHAQSEFLYSFASFQWTIAWSLSYHFSLSVSWSLKCAPLEDWFLPCSTRRLFVPSSEIFQPDIRRLLDLALIEWKPWTYGVYFWTHYLHASASACGPGLIFLWFQFENQSSPCSQDEFYSSSTIGKLPGLLVLMVELKPWPSWELFPHISAVTSCLQDAFHILPSSVLIWTCTSSRSSRYSEVHILDASFTRLITSIILHAGKFYMLRRVYSSCGQFETESATYLGSQNFEWQIPWYIGGNEGLIMQFTITTMELQPTKNYLLQTAYSMPWNPSKCMG